MTNQDEDRDVFQSQYFDPFPEPQTIPSGWDISVLMSTPQPVSVQVADDSAETESI